jgi:hypothetical protein
LRDAAEFRGLQPRKEQVVEFLAKYNGAHRRLKKHSIHCSGD